MNVFADMGPVVDFSEGDDSEETVVKVFDSLKRAFFNVASRYAPGLKNDHDFRMNVVTDAFDKLKNKGDIDFNYHGKGRAEAEKTAYAFLFRIMWNAITQRLRKMKYIDKDEDDGDAVIEKLELENYELDKVLSCADFNRELRKVFTRARLFGITDLSLDQAINDLGTPSGEFFRAVLIRCFFPEERKRVHET